MKQTYRPRLTRSEVQYLRDGLDELAPWFRNHDAPMHGEDVRRLARQGLHDVQALHRKLTKLCARKSRLHPRKTR